MPGNKKLVMVSHYYSTHGGGIEMVAGALSSGLAEKERALTWLALNCDAAPELPGVRCVALRGSNWVERRFGIAFPLFGLRTALSIWREIRGADCVITHDALFLSSLVAVVSARLLGKRAILVQHISKVPTRSALVSTLFWVGNRLVAPLMMSLAHRTVFISAAAQAYFSAVAWWRKDSFRLIQNGVDLAQFSVPDDVARQALRQRYGVEAYSGVCLFVGRFVEKKGIGLIKRLAAADERIAWVLVGWGNEVPEDWGMRNVFVFRKVAHAEMAGFYGMADLLVLPSRGEGFPLVVQEALACGTPVAISTETAEGLPFVKSVAFCAPVLDWGEADEAAWTDLVFRQALPMRNDRESMSGFAKSHWAWGRCVAQYLEIINE